MIRKELQIFFLKVSIPAVLIILIVELLKGKPLPGADNIILNTVLLVWAALSALGAPLLYRLIFINKVKDEKHLSKTAYINFQKRTLILVLSTLYVFIIASLLGVPKIVYYSIFMLALYGAYFYYPSKRKTQFEMRLFRINENGK